MAGSPVREEVKLLFFDPVLHVSSWTVNFIIKGLGAASKVRYKIAWITPFLRVFSFTNDEPCSVPCSRLIVEPTEEALFFSTPLVVSFGLFEHGLKEAGHSPVARKPDEVVDVVLFTPLQHTPTTKAGVCTKDDANLRPNFTKPFHQYFQDRPGSSGAVCIGGAKEGAERIGCRKKHRAEESNSRGSSGCRLSLVGDRESGRR